MMFWVRSDRGDSDWDPDSAVRVFMSTFDLRVCLCWCRACRVPLTAQPLILCCQLGHSARTMCAFVRRLHMGCVLALLNTLHLPNLVRKDLVVRLRSS